MLKIRFLPLLTTMNIFRKMGHYLRKTHKIGLSVLGTLYPLSLCVIFWWVNMVMKAKDHYHACLFGVGPSFADVVESTWKKGHIMLGTLTHDSAQYVAGYVTKKMTSKADPRLDDRDWEGPTPNKQA